MGAEVSRTAGRFDAVWAELPTEAKAAVDALLTRESTALLKPHPGAPPASPKVPVGITVQLDHAAAQEALAAVPRLQRKHYESIPKSLKEMDFWTNFFTHLTVIVREAKPELLAGEPLDWKGVAPGDGPNSFDAVWAELPAEKRAAVEAMCAKDATALLTPSAKSPAAFPVVPLGVEVFVDEAAATAALTSVAGLQKKHYSLVPKKLDEKTFWVNFFTQLTAIVG